MHLLRAELRSLDETAPAVDLKQTRADIVALSFTDSDLAVLAKAAERLGWGPDRLRLASLADLRHPYSVDLYVESVIAHARVVFVRLLGGLDYWRYGIEEIARSVRAQGATLAVVPGDAFADARLDAASTLPAEDLARLWAYMQHGGVDNAESALRWLAGGLGAAPPVEQGALGWLRRADGPRACVVFYRSAWLAGDIAPYEALCEALERQGFAVEALYVTSLKDPAVVSALRQRLQDDPPEVILNATAFSARLDDGSCVFDACDAPVFQVSVSLSSPQAWAASARGLSPSDLAMNVALPEVDGRIFAGAVAFKAPQSRIAALEYAPLRAEPHASAVEHAARLAAAWAALRRTPHADKRLAFVLSDYPAKGGREGYAVGLDTYASVARIFARLASESYALEAPPADLARRLAPASALSLARYRALLSALPLEFRQSVAARWGDPEEDESLSDGVFRFAFLRLGQALIALQPDRGRTATRAGDYHDANLPPRHAYVAFYLWLREEERVHALVHVGAHGTLEWLPGKAVALSESCAPRALTGALPIIYPFIVNNPGEAAQAKRRTSAVTLGHLTPPLISAPAYGATAEIEGLMDEYAEARALDPRRARRLADLVLERARDAGLAEEAGLSDDLEEALVKLDAWLCDLKDMRIGDGLHVYGEAEGEMDGLVAALAGRRVPPGPGGAPSRGRTDVLPTGRNLYALDPRAVPTRTAWDLGQRAGEAFLATYVQDHGDWPRSVVFDLWGSSAMRTGGEDLAQALWLIGARPLWDHASHRVSGYEVLPLATLGRPRVDVTLRISGLFRDIFPEQIALFHAATQAVAAREDESGQDNPLRGGVAERIFGQAPGAYGMGVARAALSGAWDAREDLGQVYLDATRFAYAGGEARATDAFREKVASAQAFVHVQDMAGQDVLDSDAFAEHEGGFAAAAASLGAAPALYHLDATDPQKPKARTLAQETARALRARAANPRWLQGQMRHGHRGAAEIAESVDNLYVLAATADVVADRHFDLLFDAVCADAEVRAFLRAENPQAARAIADRFEDARKRGLWSTRRNSVEPLLLALRGPA
jgi:cobaltochelatase CobN